MSTSVCVCVKLIYLVVKRCHAIRFCVYEILSNAERVVIGGHVSVSILQFPKNCPFVVFFPIETWNTTCCVSLRHLSHARAGEAGEAGDAGGTQGGARVRKCQHNKSALRMTQWCFISEKNCSASALVQSIGLNFRYLLCQSTRGTVVTIYAC